MEEANFTLLKEIRSDVSFVYGTGGYSDLTPAQVKYDNVYECVSTFRDLLEAQYEIEKEAKQGLTKKFPLDFKRLYVTDGKNKEAVWETSEIPLESVDDGDNFDNHAKVEENDEAIISWDAFGSTEAGFYTGKIVKLTNLKTQIKFVLKENERPPDFASKEKIIYTIQFIPSTILIRRCMIALEYLRRLPDYSFIKRIMLGDIPKQLDEPEPFLGELTGTGLTPTQERIAINAATRPFTLIQGPPATGKTRTIGAITIACLQQNPDEKILICGTTNPSVNNLIRRIKNSVNSINRKMVWLASEKKDFDIRKGVTEEQKYQMYYKICNLNSSESNLYREIQELKWQNIPLKEGQIKNDEQLRKILEHRVALNSDVVLSTLTNSAKKCLDGIIFDTVIIDEATQANEPATLIPLIHGAKRLILVGDQKQLSSMSNLNEDLNFDRSLFQRLTDELYVKPELLDCQWRMHPLISKFSNMHFYNNSIVNGITCAQRELTTRILPNNICFLYVNGQEERVNTSYWNEEERDALIQIVQDMLNDGVKPEDIGVISPYSQQIKEIKKYINVKGLAVSSVDSFQGSEREYIIVSTVRTSSSDIGFVANENRLNVTITRAKRGVIVIGNEFALSNNRMWYSFINYCKKIPNSYFIKKLPYVDDENMEYKPNNYILVDNRTGIEIQNVVKKDNIIFTKNDCLPLFSNKYSKDIVEVKSPITDQNTRILWPDDEIDMEFLQEWVNSKLDVLNSGYNVTLSFNSECICFQFGDIFPMDVDYFKWDKDYPIPSINTEDTIIVFFYGKKSDKIEYEKPCSILKPLLEHDRITIITFDFLTEVDQMRKFGVNINMKRIIDTQLLFKDSGDDQIILSTSNKSLKSAITILTNNSPLLPNAATIVKEEEENFPWSANKLLISLNKLPETSHVSEKFLEYSANDIIYTALVGIEVLSHNRLEDVIIRTKQKVDEYNNASKSCTFVRKLRQAKHLKVKENTILGSKITKEHESSITLEQWNELNEFLELSKMNNKLINELLNTDKDKVKIAEERMATAIKILELPVNMNMIKAIAEISPCKKEEEEKLGTLYEIRDLLQHTYDNRLQTENAQRAYINTILKDKKKSGSAIKFRKEEVDLLKDNNITVPNSCDEIPPIIEEINEGIEKLEKELNDEYEKIKEIKERKGREIKESRESLIKNSIYARNSEQIRLGNQIIDILNNKQSEFVICIRKIAKNQNEENKVTFLNHETRFMNKFNVKPPKTFEEIQSTLELVRKRVEELKSPTLRAKEDMSEEENSRSEEDRSEEESTKWEKTLISKSNKKGTKKSKKEELRRKKMEEKEKKKKAKKEKNNKKTDDLIQHGNNIIKILEEKLSQENKELIFTKAEKAEFNSFSQSIPTTAAEIPEAISAVKERISILDSTYSI